MPQKRRQDRQAALHVLTGPVPLHQCLHSESMAEIVKTRPMTIRRATQPDLPRQEVKRAPDLGTVQPCATAGYEECLWPSSQKTIPPRRVGREHFAGRSMNGYQAGLAELRSPNGENAFFQVHIFCLQAARFADTQSRHRQEP